MDKTEAQKVLSKYGVNLSRLIAWLQHPKQGIPPQIAVHVIAEVSQEIKEGKEYFREPLMYEEGLRKIMAARRAPVDFWVDRYILERCRWVMEDHLGDPALKEMQYANLANQVAQNFEDLHGWLIELQRDMGERLNLDRLNENYTRLTRMTADSADAVTSNFLNLHEQMRRQWIILLCAHGATWLLVGGIAYLAF